MPTERAARQPTGYLHSRRRRRASGLQRTSRWLLEYSFRRKKINGYDGDGSRIEPMFPTARRLLGWEPTQSWRDIAPG